jgi:BirA family biotin operon repressor/biotin-[acetyl-CoA-carboxylase] ligase
MLATSVLLRPARAGILGAEAKGWIPLLAGLAMTRALISLHAPAELKWPNDVMIRGGKVCGILVDAQPGDAIIVGAGVNLAMTVGQLPVPTATSMLIAGAETDPDVVLAAYLANLRELYAGFARARGDAEQSGLHAAVAEACSTLGREVRVQVPGNEELSGVAVELDWTGHLVVESDGQRVTVAAGDVTHLRY